MAVHSSVRSMYVLECDVRAGTRIPLAFFWGDEKCYGQDRSDRSGSDGPVSYRENAVLKPHARSNYKLSPTTASLMQGLPPQCLNFDYV